MMSVRDVSCPLTPEGSRTIEFEIDRYEDFPEMVRPALIACDAVEVALTAIVPFAGSSVGAKIADGTVSITYCPDLPDSTAKRIERLISQSIGESDRDVASKIVDLVNQITKERC